MFKFNFRKKLTLPLVAVLIFILIFFILTVMSFFNYESQDIRITKNIIEDKGLEKIDLQLKENETYIYKVYFLDENFNVTYQTLNQNGLICIIENMLNEINTLCIDENGLSPNNYGSNISYPYPIYVFAPWMLAVSKDWTWKITGLIDISGEEYIQIDKITYTYFRSLGEEEIFGRIAYKIEISDKNNKEICWIDKEKRVLLKKIGNIDRVELIKGPFTLSQQQEE